MYVLVLDHGYDGYSTDEYQTLHEVLDKYDRSSADFHALYEIKREITQYEIHSIRETAAVEKAAAIEAAKSKLTPAELRLLGIA